MKVDKLIQLIHNGLMARINFPEASEGFPIEEAVERGSELGMTTDKNLAQKYGGKYVNPEELGSIAQRSEQSAHNREVGGSNPPGSKKKRKPRPTDDIYRVYNSAGRKLREYYRQGDATLYINANLPESSAYTVIAQLDSKGLSRRVKITAVDWIAGKRPSKE